MRHNMMRNILTATIAGAMVLSLAACGSTNGANAESTSAAQESSAQAESTGSTQADSKDGGAKAGESVLIPDPFEEFSAKEDAEKAAGFTIELPEAMKGYENVVYRVDADGKLIEVIYSDKDLGEDGAVEAYRIRKAVGADDISGDYYDYSEVNEETNADGAAVTLKGNDGKVFVATWVSGEYTYAIDVDLAGLGLTAEEVMNLVNATR